MRKIIFLIHVSLDGLVAGPNGEMDWIVYNEEVEKYAHSLHATTDAAIYGRVTYQMMQGYWPTVLADPTAGEGDKNHARWYENATKIVVSRTLMAGGDKTLLIRDNLGPEIEKIKQQPGKNLWLLGSPTLAQAMMRLNLIDEYRINVNPVMLGRGRPLFAGLDDQRHLKLLEATPFKGGVVALRYETVRQ
ncbi:MAG TPA: dihydrofolate reductase family protein [Phototrophicaceae bacterium]|nr:dihydrofolate reductase family protein [Phototrophicaceae bacterium]